MRFAQIGDPHLTSLESVNWRDLCNKRVLGYLSWQRRRRFIHRREILDALRDDLHAIAPDIMLIMGDLIQISLPAEFAAAAEWLAELGDPTRVFAVPGNHDRYVPTESRNGLSLWSPFMTGDSGSIEEPLRFPTLRQFGELALIGVDTSIPTPPFTAYGRVGDQQLRALAEILAQSANRELFRVVILHHPPAPGVETWRKRLVDADAFRDVIEQHGAELICHGHSHRWLINSIGSPHGPVPVVGVPSSSSASKQASRTAAYGLYEISRTEPGWHLKLIRRRYRQDIGRFDELDNRTFSCRR